MLGSSMAEIRGKQCEARSSRPLAIFKNRNFCIERWVPTRISFHAHGFESCSANRHGPTDIQFPNEWNWDPRNGATASNCSESSTLIPGKNCALLWKALIYWQDSLRRMWLSMKKIRKITSIACNIANSARHGKFTRIWLSAYGY